jgi:hypothetical protein
MLIKVHDSQNGFRAIILQSVSNSQEPQFMDAQGTPRTSSAQGKDPEKYRVTWPTRCEAIFNCPRGWSTEELVPNEGFPTPPI